MCKIFVEFEAGESYNYCCNFLKSGGRDVFFK